MHRLDVSWGAQEGLSRKITAVMNRSHKAPSDSHTIARWVTFRSLAINPQVHSFNPLIYIKGLLWTRHCAILKEFSSNNIALNLKFILSKSSTDILWKVYAVRHLVKDFLE